MSHFSVRSLIIGITFAALAAVSPAAHAQVLDPAAYTSDGALSLASGAYTLDTDALTFNGYSGVLSNGIAVFDFSSINVGANAAVNVVGSHPLALLSQSDATFGAGSSFNLNGGNGGFGQIGTSPFPPSGAGGAAGSGGYAGGAGGGDGAGPGGGGAAYSGGSFGGRGGNRYGIIDGSTYGNLLTKLEGGSGGGGSQSFYGAGHYASGGGGGGGGGAIEISSVGALTLAGNINAHGGGGNLGGAGYGSGGAGGGVLLSGSRISLTATGQVNANGGDVISYSSPGADGGGGGGRITIQTIIPNGLLDNGTLNVNGGLGSYHGEAGVITVITAVPEPGAGSLLVAVLGAVPVVAALRRRRK